MPVSSAPTALRPAQSAVDENRTSTDGQWPLTFNVPPTCTRYSPPDRISRICIPPGANNARPGNTRSPSLASRTYTALLSSRRCANAVVNPAGMCCTMTMPGALAGI